MALTSVSYQNDGIDLLTNDLFFKTFNFQASYDLPAFISNEPNLAAIVASFLQHISDIRVGKSSVSF